MSLSRTTRSRIARALASMLVLGSWLLGTSLAEAACLTGAGITGLESGNQTLHVSIPNTSGFSQAYGISCEGSSGIVDPGAAAFGTGLARFKTSSLGYRLYTSSVVGGIGSGSGGANALGSVRYLVRVNSTPSYTGPTTVSLIVSMQFDVSGGTSASGVASAGGSYDTEVSLKPADVQFGGVVLFIGGSALSPGGSSILQNSTPIDIDRDYILQISHNQAVSTTFATGAMGEPGSAASSGTVAMSFTSELALLDAELSIEYPMVGLQGVPAPSLGNPPVFSAIVPASGAAGIALMLFLMTRVAMSKLRRDDRDPLDTLSPSAGSGL